MEDGNSSNNKSIKDFIKKNPKIAIGAGIAVLGSLLFMGIIISVVAMHQQIFSAFSTFFGVVESWFTDGKYKDITLAEIQDPNFDFGSCYMNTSDNWFEGSWKWIRSTFTSDMVDKCELIELVKHEVKVKERKYRAYNLKLSPGLAVATIIYGYSSQPRVEGQEVIDPSQPMKVLDDIVKDGIFTTSDIEEMIDNMLFSRVFWYYSCDDSCEEGNAFSETSNNENNSGYSCKKAVFKDVFFSRSKFNIFLRFGSDVANAYEAALNHNTSKDYICDTCYSRWNEDTNYKETFNQFDDFEVAGEKIIPVIDLTKPVTKDSTTTKIVFTEEEINLLKEENIHIPSALRPSGINIIAGKKYLYTDGFIYKKFPNSETFLDIFENVEKIIESNNNYEEVLNGVFGVKKIISGSRGRAKLSLHKEIKEDCTTGEACGCSKDGLEPPILISGGELLDLEYSELSSFSLIENARKFLGYDQKKMRAVGMNAWTNKWCASFVSFILKITPEHPLSGVAHSSVYKYINWFREHGRFCNSQAFYYRNENYRCDNSPLPGDIILFASSPCDYEGNAKLHATKQTGCSHHVGIVSEVTENELTYIHGNTNSCGGNQVCETTIPLKNGYIIGYGR